MGLEIIRVGREATRTRRRRFCEGNSILNSYLIFLWRIGSGIITNIWWRYLCQNEAIFSKDYSTDSQLVALLPPSIHVLHPMDFWASNRGLMKSQFLNTHRSSDSQQKTNRTMKMNPVSIALLFLYFTFAAGTKDPTHFTGDFSINCGSSGTSAALSGKQWRGDVQQKFSSMLQIKGSSTTSSIGVHKLKSADPVPNKTARLSRYQFSYAFQVNPGQKIIRLHFSPSQYKGYKGLKDLLNVEAGPFTLLSNFSASLTANALGVSSFTKEFCLNIQENKQLSITFSAATGQSGDITYAFINGIEIISVPDSVSYFHGGNIGVQVVGHRSLVYVDHDTALEIVHRLNIKQNPIPSTGDSDDMFPTWVTREANKIKKAIWRVPVDVGFRYLIRIYFSEIGIKIAGTADVVFKLFINEMLAQTNIDIVKERSDNNNPWYSDYTVILRGQRNERKRDLLISLESYNEVLDAKELLAGFQILKVSNPDNSLASPNPLPPPQDSPSQTVRTLLCILGQRNSIGTVAVILTCVVNIIVHKLREIWEASLTEEKNKPSARAERVCRRFSLAELKLATKNFSDALLIGRGGFGKVYKGLIDNGQESVAIKRQKFTSSQGAHEFLTEIEMLSELRHVNLVSLIGYCNDHGEMILVYEYMAYGTLADHLYKLARDKCYFLSWKQRLNICIGAGRGLDYLHTGHRVIHRDVKASNILLDETFVAKVSDFGLAKPEDKKKLQSHVSTKVKGTYGYLDPFYFTTCKLTRKSDTYAFGVVLLEVLCERSAVDSKLEEDEQILSKWALDKIGKGEIDKIVASSLREEISADSLNTFVGVAERCLYDEPKNRPTMSQVVLQLEFALEQQENKQLSVSNEIASVSDGIRPCSDAIVLSVNTRQLKRASTDVQNLTPLPEEQTNSRVVKGELPYVRKDGRKAIMHKPSRLWPWDALRSRVKPSKKDELLSSEICEADIKLAKFDWNTIAAATNHFSSSNKVGEGGFGPVYKAVLPAGLVVAVKRHSPSSQQGLNVFKNEILLLPNLQHRNIIKLLGYCIRREERLLVYEFMENRSLDTYLDKVRHEHFQWQVRLKIIMGIARAVVYLHRDSGQRVIYRDLKSGNILLDNEMNPRISEFGFAMTLVDDQSELEIPQIIGTYGYTSPEYCMHGILSIKSDVFSFGIIVLEIVSGRGRYLPDQEPIFLLDYAWKLWKEGRVVDLIGESLKIDGFPLEEVLRCVQVGLLCAQLEPHDRPEMPHVIKMLEGDEPLVEPKEPWLRTQDPWLQSQKGDSSSNSVHTHTVGSLHLHETLGNGN